MFISVHSLYIINPYFFPSLFLSDHNAVIILLDMALFCSTFIEIYVRIIHHIFTKSFNAFKDFKDQSTIVDL